MKKLTTWMLLFIVLAAAVYVAVAVPLGGRTLLQRLRGEPGPQPVSTGVEADAGPASGAASVRKADPRDNDRLTDEDRRELDQLIESKLQEGGGEANSPGQP